MSSKSVEKPASKFAQLHSRQQKRVKASRKMSNTLMALSADDHKAMAQLIAKWLNETKV